MHVCWWYRGRSILELGKAYFAHAYFDRAINEVRTPCLANTKKRPEGHNSFDGLSPSMCDLCWDTLSCPIHPLPTELQAQYIQAVIYKRCLVFNNLFICSNNLDNAIKVYLLNFQTAWWKACQAGWRMRLEFRVTGWRKSMIKFIRHKCKVKNSCVKLQKERFRLQVLMKVRVVTGWNGLSQEVVESPSLDSLETSIKSDRGIIDLPIEVFPDLLFLSMILALHWHGTGHQIHKCLSTEIETACAVARALDAWTEHGWSSLVCAHGRRNAGTCTVIS